MTIDALRKWKQEKGYTYAQLSEKSGIPVGTLQKIFNGETSSPRYATILALQSAFLLDNVIKDEPDYPDYPTYHYVKRQGEYTIDDYYALPEDQRVELIDGYFYDMAAPTTYHQIIGGEVYRQISNYILDKNGSCTPFISPIDVQLDNDERTMLQPDVIIVCKKNQVITRNVIGAPDFIMEVVSPSSKRRDYLLKLHKYQDAGVREYWLVDPGQNVVTVYFFEDDTCPVIYPMNGEIPVNIYNGELTIHFDRIAAWVEEIKTRSNE